MMMTISHTTRRMMRHLMFIILGFSFFFTSHARKVSSSSKPEDKSLPDACLYICIYVHVIILAHIIVI